MGCVAVHGILWARKFSLGNPKNGLPFLSPRDLPDPGIESMSPALQVDSSPFEPPGKLHLCLSPDPNTHPVSPMLAIIHSISFKPTGNLVAPPSKCIQHLTTEIQNITVYHYSTLAAPLPSALAPEMCSPRSSQSEPIKKEVRWYHP